MAKAKKAALKSGSSQSKMNAASKSKAGQIVLVRILVIVLIAVAAGTLLDFVREDAAREYPFHTNVLPVLRIVFLALLAGAAIYLAVTLVKKVDTSAHWVTPGMLVVIGLYLAGTALFYDRVTMFPPLFYTATVIGCVLFAVYYIYTVLLYKK